MADLATIESAVRVFCTCRADGQLYGIEVSHLREVSTQVTTTPVPQAPPAIRGLTNLRSRVYLVIDLRALLGLEPVECTIESRLIILKPGFGEDMGILVDRGGDVIRVKEDDIAWSAHTPAPTGGEHASDVAASLTAGVCKLEHELMVILDPGSIASEVARQVR